MTRSLILAAVWCIAAGTPGPAHAEPAPTDGKTCFCLRHVSSGAVATGCHASKGRTDFYATAICWDEHGGKPGTPFSIDGGWSLIQEGDDRCRPCERRSAPDPRELPRKPEE